MRPRRALVVVVVALVLPTVSACTSSSTVDGTTAVEGPADPTSRPETPTSTASPVVPARRAPSVVVAQAPRRATLPSGRAVSIRAVGTTTAGLLDVPGDIGIAGWWRGGARLGDPFGSIVVAAHVDSRTQGLGPFAELLTIEPGTRILLESDGLRQAFVARSRRLVAQGSLVDDSWIFTSSGHARLTLVTCAPPYDASRGGYQNLAVVTALPVGDPEAT